MSPDEPLADGSVACRIAAMYVHPIKSCASVAVDERALTPTGLDLDRDWMVVDTHGDMLTQRELPRLALVQPSFKHGDVVLRAPGMLALHLRIDTVESATHAQVWDDHVRAFEMGALAGQWFSDFLGRPGLRLVRRPSTVSTASASHTRTKPHHRAAGISSWKASHAVRLPSRHAYTWR